MVFSKSNLNTVVSSIVKASAIAMVLMSAPQVAAQELRISGSVTEDACHTTEHAQVLTVSCFSGNNRYDTRFTTADNLQTKVQSPLVVMAFNEDIKKQGVNILEITYQ